MKFNWVHAREELRRNRLRLTCRRLYGCAGVAVLAATALWALAQQPPRRTTTQPIVPVSNFTPDAIYRAQQSEAREKAQSFDAANAERLREMAQESDILVTMAMALNAELDSAKSAEPSPNAIRKAETIEKLARSVRKKMELTVGSD